MIAKASTMPLTVFVMTGVLLVTSDLPAFGPGSRGSERQSHETAKRAEELFQEALLLSNTEERESARLRLQEAMRLWMQMREPEKAARAALQMGDHYKQARNYQNALDYYKQTLGVKGLPALVRINALNAIALVYGELYQTDLAARYFLEALKQARIINDFPAQRLSLTGLANTFYQQGDRAQALSYIARAQELNRQRGAEVEPALLCLLGQISQEEGLLDKAKKAFEEALEIFNKALNAEGQIRVLTAISIFYLLSSKKQEALEQAEKAVELAETEAKRAVRHEDKVSIRALRWRAWLSRARAERAMGQKERALKSYFWAINHFEGTWWAAYIATETSSIAFREEIQAAYREYVDLLVGKWQLKEAYELAEAAKSRTILNSIEARRLMPQSKDNNLAPALSELYQSITNLRLQLYASNNSPEQQSKLQKAIHDAEYKVQELQLQSEIARFKQRLVWSPLTSMEPLQDKTARDQVALAEFSLTEERSFVWLFAQGNVFFEILPSRKEIEKAVKHYLDVLTSTPNHLHMEEEVARARDLAEALFSALFGRLSRQIALSRRLIVVPDGLLHYLPFEALILNGRYLVEDFEISYSSSASLLDLWQDSVTGVKSEDKLELLAIGNPVFEPGLTRAGGKESRNGSSKAVRQMLAARGFRFESLPRAQDEIQYIANLFPPDRRKVLMGRDCTEDAIKRESLRHYRRLHLATHGLIDEKSPLRSSVILTPDDEGREDGFLDVNEISRLDLDCDLVVVSACQTGRGQLLSGEGIIGLSRAFLYAGARSVVVSLWNVSDISTGRLMKNFYQNLTDGLHNASALRRAKLQMLNSGKETRHPYYWSAFILIGKP